MTPRRAFTFTLVGVVALMLVCLPGAGVAQAAPEIGVLIVAHGAPMPEWNKLPLALGAEVEKQLVAEGGKMTAAIAMLEFAKPSVVDVVKQFEEQGITKIVAIPLFIAPSGHSVYDVPCVLGIAYDRATMDTLAGEGAEIVRSDAAIILTQPLAEGDVLPQVMLERAKEVSRAPAEEAVIVLAHGDPGFSPQWDDLTSRVCEKLETEGGFASVSSALIGMGMGSEFSHSALPVLKEAAEAGNRVIVVGLYVGMSGDGYARRARKQLPKGTEIVGTKSGTLPHALVVEWVIETAKAAAAVRFGDAE